MESKEAIKQIDAYIERWRFDGRVERYDPKKEGAWEIMCGAGQTPEESAGARISASVRTPLVVAHGTFLDALEYAVGLEKFYGNSYKGKVDTTGSTASGFIRPYQPKEGERVEPQAIPESKLYGKIADYSENIKQQ